MEATLRKGHSPRSPVRKSAVQCRASCTVKEFRGWSYDQRLNLLNWNAQEEKRLRGDVIEVFKLLNSVAVGEPNIFFQRSLTGLKGHEFKLYKSSFCTNLGIFSFSNRVFQDWNGVYHSMLYQVTMSTITKIGF